MPNDNKLPNTGDDQQLNQSNPTTPMDDSPTANTSTNSTTSLPPIMVSEEALPPMPQMSNPEPVTIDSAKTEEPKTDVVNSSPADVSLPTDMGSAAPANDIVNPVMPAVVTSTPKKKFAGGKVIATILGLFLLVGGIGAGVFLTGQNQNINEKAAAPGTCMCNDSQGNPVQGSCTSSHQCDCGSLEVRNDRCNDTGSGGGGTQPSQVVSCSLEDGVNVVQCGTTPSGCGGFCITTTTKNCDQMLLQECNYTPDRGASYQAGFAAQSYCPSGYNSAFCNCANPAGPAPTIGVCFDRGLNGQCTGADGLCAVYASGQTSGGANGANCGTVSTYYCPGVDYTASGQSCIQNLDKRPAGFCGTIQVDTACQGFKSTYVPCNEGGTEPTPSAPGITAVCQNVKAYSETWTLLTSAQLSQLNATDKVNFCVAGVATGESFDKAKFTINGVVQAETTDVRPSSTDFCQLYTIPAATTAFTVSAQIHHITLGYK